MCEIYLILSIHIEENMSVKTKQISKRLKCVLNFLKKNPKTF